MEYCCLYHIFNFISIIKLKLQMKKLILFILLFFTILINSQEAIFRNTVMNTFKSQIGVRELTGNNDGLEVEKYLASTGLGKGYAWCASFPSWVLKKHKIPNPKSAWSPHWANRKDMVWEKGMPISLLKKMMREGDQYTLWYNSLDRVGHVGTFETWNPNNRIGGIEGNTNIKGSREGDGVYRKSRSLKYVYRVTNYISPYLQDKVVILGCPARQ